MVARHYCFRVVKLFYHVLSSFVLQDFDFLSDEAWCFVAGPQFRDYS